MMKKIKILAATVLVLCSVNLSGQDKNMMPFTYSNPEALKVYQEAFAAFEKSDMGKAFESLNKAIELEPKFFMPHFNLAMNYLPGNVEKFKEVAKKAIAIDVELNDGEKIFKQIIERWLKDPKSDVTDLGAKLIGLYPNDQWMQLYQSFFYAAQKKFEEAIAANKNVIKMVKNKAPYYNLLGYRCMEAGKMKEAENAFDKYIGLEPKEANPYDSKGDYYMAIKDYQKAHDSFMKAYELDTNFTFSKKKAEKAKQMMEGGGK